MLYRKNSYTIKQIKSELELDFKTTKIILMPKNKINRKHRNGLFGIPEQDSLFYDQKNKTLYVCIEKRDFMHIAGRLTQSIKYLDTIQSSNIEVICGKFEKFLYPIFLGILSAGYSFLEYKTNSEQQNKKNFYFKTFSTFILEKAEIIDSNLSLIRDLVTLRLILLLQNMSPILLFCTQKKID